MDLQELFTDFENIFPMLRNILHFSQNRPYMRYLLQRFFRLKNGFSYINGVYARTSSISQNKSYQFKMKMNIRPPTPETLGSNSLNYHYHSLEYNKFD